MQHTTYLCKDLPSGYCNNQSNLLFTCSRLVHRLYLFAAREKWCKTNPMVGIDCSSEEQRCNSYVSDSDTYHKSHFSLAFSAFDESHSSSRFEKKKKPNFELQNGFLCTIIYFLPFTCQGRHRQRLAKRRWKEMKTAFLHFKGGKTNLGEPSVAIYQPKPK